LLNNPEFKRSIVVSLSSYRSFVMPVAMLILLYLTFVLHGQTFSESLSVSCSVIFLLLVFFFCTRDVNDSIMDEVMQRTWDFQRMSAISAWTMVWGKLLGSCFFSLLTASLALVLAVYSMMFTSSFIFMLKSLILLVIVALISITVSLMTTLFLLRKNPQTTSKQTHFLSFILAIVMMFISLPFVTAEQQESIVWFSSFYSWFDFVLLSGLFFLCTFLIACYRLMRQELQYQNSPLVWLFFLVSQTLYWSGFYIAGTDFEFDAHWFGRETMVFFSSIILCWLAIYASNNKIQAIYKSIFYLKNRNYPQLWLNLPLWVVSYAFVLTCALYLFVVINESFLLILMCCLFLLRDIFLSLYFGLKNSSGKADMSSLITLLSLYVFIPIILINLELKSWLFLFLPYIEDEQSLWVIIPVMLQTVLSIMLAVYSLRLKQLE